MWGSMINALISTYNAQDMRERQERARRQQERSYIAQLPPAEREAAWQAFVREQQQAAERHHAALRRREAKRLLEEAADRTYRDPTSDYFDPWLVMEERLGLRTTSTFEEAVARWADTGSTQSDLGTESPLPSASRCVSEPGK